jgi:BMFP domain-containing protein YqiC
MVNQAPKAEELLEQIATLEDRLQSTSPPPKTCAMTDSVSTAGQDKTMEELKAAITASHRLTDHMAPVLHFQTREHAMHERKALEDENHRLNTLLEQQAKAHEESLSNAKSGDEGVRKRIAELEEDGALPRPRVQRRLTDVQLPWHSGS